MDKKVFFAELRGSVLFGGKLSQTQVNGMDAVLDYWDNNHADKPLSYLAYILATGLIETAYTFVPVRERGGNNYLRLLYDVTGNRPELAKRYGNTSPGDGIKYAGKGFVQLTWKSNYVKQSRKLGIDLVSHPEMLLRLDVSVKVLVEGMLDGDFRGVSLSDCLDNVVESDLWNAFNHCRDIVNANDDNASLYANAAMAFYRALKASVAPDNTPATQATGESSDEAFTKDNQVKTDIIINQAEIEAFRRWQSQQVTDSKPRTEILNVEFKPLWKSAVARWIVAGIASYLSVRYGFDLPDQTREWAENIILGVMSIGTLRGRFAAKTFISGLFK